MPEDIPHKTLYTKTIGETDFSLIEMEYKNPLSKQTKLYIGHCAPISIIKLTSFRPDKQYKLVIDKPDMKKTYYSTLVYGYQTFDIQNDETSFLSHLNIFSQDTCDNTNLPFIKGDHDAYIELVSENDNDGYFIYDKKTDMFHDDEYIMEFNHNFDLVLHPNHQFEIDHLYSPITKININKNIQSKIQNNICKLLPNDEQDYVFDNTTKIQYQNDYSAVFTPIMAFRRENYVAGFDATVKTIFPEHVGEINENSLYFNNTHLPTLNFSKRSMRNNMMTIMFDKDIPSSELKDIQLTSYYYNMTIEMDHEGRKMIGYLIAT